MSIVVWLTFPTYIPTLRHHNLHGVLLFVVNYTCAHDLMIQRDIVGHARSSYTLLTWPGQVQAVLELEQDMKPKSASILLMVHAHTTHGPASPIVMVRLPLSFGIRTNELATIAFVHAGLQATKAKKVMKMLTLAVGAEPATNHNGGH